MRELMQNLASQPKTSSTAEKSASSAPVSLQGTLKPPRDLFDSDPNKTADWSRREFSNVDLGNELKKPLKIGGAKNQKAIDSVSKRFADMMHRYLSLGRLEQDSSRINQTYGLGRTSGHAMSIAELSTRVGLDGSKRRHALALAVLLGLILSFVRYAHGLWCDFEVRHMTRGAGAQSFGYLKPHLQIVQLLLLCVSLVLPVGVFCRGNRG